MIYGVRCFSCRFAGISEHGIFNGIDDMTKYKRLKVQALLCIFTIEWE